MAGILPVLQAFGETLDGIDVALCAFDAHDAALHWNRSFLKFFPEHDGHVHVGESYEANLRRFYSVRLSPAEQGLIEQYIQEGLTRHRLQSRPFVFEHRGLRLQVASLPLPGGGRIRTWKSDPLSASSQVIAPHPDQPERQSLEAELFDRLPEGVLLCTVDHIILWVNQPLVLMYGLPRRDAAIGLSFRDAYRAAWAKVPSDNSAAAAQAAGLAVLTERLRFAGAPFELPLPGDRWVRVVGQANSDGTGTYALADITELKRQQERLSQAERQARESEARLQQKSALLEATLERMEQGVMMVNAQRIVEVCNRRAMELLDLPRELMSAQPRFEDVLAHQWSTHEFDRTPESLKAFVRAGGILDQPQCYERMRPDGRVIEVNSVPIEGGGVLRTYTDITERKRNEDRIRHIARHDGLTSLVNRDVFRECLEAATQTAAESGTGFAVHYLDLDGFKPVNDRHGHAVGDKLLASVAARMRQVARDGDVVARMGGDEFAVLQQGVDQADRALSLAWRLIEAIGQPCEIESHRVQVGASVGIALWPSGGRDAESLLRHADMAMYRAKSAGRNGVSVHAAEPPLAPLA